MTKWKWNNDIKDENGRKTPALVTEYGFDVLRWDKTQCRWRAMYKGKRLQTRASELSGTTQTMRTQSR
jgi:hypothetical protein